MWEPLDIQSIEYDVIGMHERHNKMNVNGGLVLNFKVDELLSELMKNRGDHKKIYDEATAGFKSIYKKKLGNMLTMLEKDEIPALGLGLTIPTNNLAEYDTAIKMLQMTTETELQLTQEQFNCYVMDQWVFSRNFLVGALQYDSNTARRKMLYN